MVTENGILLCAGATCYAWDIRECLKCASCVSLWAIKWCVYASLGPYVFYVLNIRLKSDNWTQVTESTTQFWCAV